VKALHFLSGVFPSFSNSVLMVRVVLEVGHWLTLYLDSVEGLDCNLNFYHHYFSFNFFLSLLYC
jgi:hypothetical protein